MTLTLIRGHHCQACQRVWHFLCRARRGALNPGACVCDCRDAEGITTEAGFLESARRAPEHLARHLRVQQAMELLGGDSDAPHPESVDSLPPPATTWPSSAVRAIAERTRP